jgi:hypothetical protein
MDQGELLGELDHPVRAGLCGTLLDFGPLHRIKLQQLQLGRREGCQIHRGITDVHHHTLFFY